MLLRIIFTLSRSLFIVLGKGTLTKSIEIRAYTVQIANKIMIKSVIKTHK